MSALVKRASKMTAMESGIREDLEVQIARVNRQRSRRDNAGRGAVTTPEQIFGVFQTVRRRRLAAK